MKSILALLFALAILPHAAQAYTFDSSVPANIKAQTIDDLTMIESIRSAQASDLHKQIFGEVDGGVYSRFFDSHIDRIGVDSCGGGAAVACVYPIRGKRMFLTQNYIKFSHPQIARLMVLFHEARHTESAAGNWGHADCPVPFKDSDGKDMKSIWTGALLAGQPACDVTPKGSYGSSMIMLKNISKFCTSCAEKVKMDAGIYADDQYKRVIDDGAIKDIYDDLYRQ